MPIIIRRRKKDGNVGDTPTSENSKNITSDEKNKRVEKINSTRDKAKSSTKTGGDSGKSGKPGKSVPEIPEIPEPHSVSVDDSNKSQSRETDKNRISAEEFLAQEIVEGKDSRYRVKISVYRVGEEERVKGDDVVRRAKLKFVISYKDTVIECVDNCNDAIKEVAKATSYKVSKAIIALTISNMREKYSNEEEIPLVDYVREKYPDRLAEIEKDPFTWILQRTREIVGYDRLKILTFLAIVSSQMERVMGMSRLHLMLVGRSGAGKSSTIKSVTRFIESTDMYISGTRFTQNSLGYLDIETFDGKVLFLEQIDKQHINYLREMMSEDKICTLVTEKVTDERGERYESHLKCIPGQAVVITTSVADTIDVDREQIFNRFLKVYVNPESSETERIIESILSRQSTEISEIDKLVFMAYLKTRPKFADITPVLEKAKSFVISLQEYTREPLTRVTEVLRNLIIAVSIARGKTKADENDLQFVMQNFQLDVLYNGLGLTEGDVEIIKLLPDGDGMKSAEIADSLRVSKQYAINTLKNLERKGVVEGEKEDGKTFTWYLTPLGRKIKALVSDVIEVRNEKGELIGIADSKFRDDNDAGNTMRGDDTRAVSRGDEKNNRVIEAYKWLKEHGAMSVAELTELYGDDIIEKLKAKDLVTFNVVDGVEYVYAK